jgi:hypothetical protein
MRALILETFSGKMSACARRAMLTSVSKFGGGDNNVLWLSSTKMMKYKAH